MASVWIDLDNAPHVAIFKPLIREFESRGHSVTVTLREHGFTSEMADQAGINYTTIGVHPGGSRVLKVVSLIWRSLRMALWARGRGFDVAVSHGSGVLWEVRGWRGSLS